MKVNESIFQTMVPVLMTGEMNEWSAEVPIGEVHNFEWELFKNSTDTNIQLLVKVMELVDETFLSLQMTYKWRRNRSEEKMIGQVRGIRTRAGKYTLEIYRDITCFNRDV